MNRLWKSVPACVLLALTAPLCAQKTAAGPANEVAFLLGGTFTPSRSAGGGQSIQLDPALTFGLAYDRRVGHFHGGAVSVGVDFAASPFDVKSSSGPATAISEYAYIFATPHLRYTFRPQAAVAPWVSAGVGFADYNEGTYNNGTPNPKTHDSKGVAGSFGGGVDWNTGRKLIVPIILRVQAQDYVATSPIYNRPTPGSQNNVIVAGGFVLRF